MRLRTISVLACVGAAALQAAPVDCGTVDSPLACSIQVNGQVEYTFSNFQVVNSNVFTGADLAIELNTGGALTALLRFKPATAASFAVNSGDFKSILFTYDVALSALQPGTAVFDTPNIVSYGLTSGINAAFASLQMTLLNDPLGETCVALVNSVNQTQDECLLPPGTTNALVVGNSLSMTAPPAGPNGQNNLGIQSLNNLLSASFVPDEVDTNPPGGAVPEPSTWAMLGSGLAALVLRSRRKNQRG